MDKKVILGRMQREIILDYATWIVVLIMPFAAGLYIGYAQGLSTPYILLYGVALAFIACFAQVRVGVSKLRKKFVSTPHEVSMRIIYTQCIICYVLMFIGMFLLSYAMYRQ